MAIIAGRRREQEIFSKVLDSKEASFLAVYGRRRIGKTYLIENYFMDKGEFFNIAGLQDGTFEEQLRRFAKEISLRFRKGQAVDTPKDWFDAFHMLREEIEKIPKQTKIILFFDELPWLATPRSKLIQELDHFWNKYLSKMPNVILIVCGSAASWMIDNIIHNKGGLHGRITREIRMLPFTLSETEEYLTACGINLDRKQILELYMCLGGVAKYLAYAERGQSAAQIVGELCFSITGALIAEFHELYRSLFNNHEEHEKIVTVLAKHRSGLSYRDIVKETKISAGGTLSRRLDELKQSGFILEAPIFGKGVKDFQYILIDEYSLFYLTWMAGVSSLDLRGAGPDYWVKRRNSQAWKSWAGFAFEALCLKHIDGIKAGLGLSVIQTQTTKWKYIAKRGAEADPQDVGCEIDLVIDRADSCINLCEMKYYDDEFVIDKDYARKLIKKRMCFERVTKTKKATFITLVTTYGVKHNEHYLGSVDKELTMDALFLK